MLSVVRNSSLIFIEKSKYSTVLLVGNHLDKCHGSFEVPLEPSFPGEKYKLVNVLAVPLENENEAFLLLAALTTPGCGSVLLLAAGLRFPFNKC